MSSPTWRALVPWAVHIYKPLALGPFIIYTCQAGTPTANRNLRGYYIALSPTPLPDSYFKGLCWWNILNYCRWPMAYIIKAFHIEACSLWPSYISLKFINLKITTFSLESCLLESDLTEAFYHLMFSVLMHLNLFFSPTILSHGLAKIMWLFLFWVIPDLLTSLCNVEL